MVERPFHTLVEEYEGGSLLHACHIGVHAFEPWAPCDEHDRALGIWKTVCVYVRFSIVFAAVLWVRGHRRLGPKLCVGEEGSVECRRLGGVWGSVGGLYCHGVYDASSYNWFPVCSDADVGGSCSNGWAQCWWSARPLVVNHGHGDHLGGMAFGALWWLVAIRRGRIYRKR